MLNLVSGASGDMLITNRKNHILVIELSSQDRYDLERELENLEKGQSTIDHFILLSRIKARLVMGEGPHTESDT